MYEKPDHEVYYISLGWPDEEIDTDNPKIREAIKLLAEKTSYVMATPGGESILVGYSPNFDPQELFSYITIHRKKQYTGDASIDTESILLYCPELIFEMYDFEGKWAELQSAVAECGDRAIAFSGTDRSMYYRAIDLYTESIIHLRYLAIFEYKTREKLNGDV